MLKKWLMAAMAVVMLLAAGLPVARVSAHEAVKLYDELADETKMFSHTDNWTIDGSRPEWFDGDGTRAVPEAAPTQSIDYHLQDLQSFTVRLYSFAGTTAIIKFYGSSNGIDWSEIQAVHDTPSSSGDAAWKGTNYSPAAALQKGLNYFRIEISKIQETAPWHMQLGSVLLTNVSEAPQTLEDQLDDWSLMDSHSANAEFDTTNPSFFGGDGSRWVRKNLTEEYISYHLHGLKTFAAKIHVFFGSTATIKFYGSSDGNFWYELPAVHDTPISTGDAAWLGATYSPDGPIPVDTNYLKLAVSGDEESWRVQVGSVTLSNRLASAGQGDFYVDSAGGNDNNDGKTPESAWKTLVKVNEQTFAPGDRILLKSGSIWTGQLQPKGSGTVDSPITLSSYGSGPKPIVNGGGIAGGTVYLINQSHWVIENLEVTNSASERGDTFREGIFVENAGAGTIEGIRIASNYVHDVSGSFRYAGGDPHAFGGITVYAGGGTAATDRFDGVLIEENTVERVGRTGIVVWDQIWNGTGFSSENVVIRQNYVKESDSDGILTFGVDGGLIEHNVVEGAGVYSEHGEFNGTAAIWPTRGKNNVVQFNEAFNTYKPEGDGQGFNLDIDTTDSIVQYNYSHDNEGGFILFVDASNTSGTENGSTNNIVRYNISQNDAKHTFTFAGGVSAGTQIYNNTVYIGTNSNAKIIDHEWDDAGDVNAPYSFKNNLIYNLGSGGYNLPGAGGEFDSNLFYGNHPVSEPADANKVTDNPLLVYQGGGAQGWNSVNGYMLRDGSAALGAGAVIKDNGGRDYWGNTISPTASPNIGAFGGEGLDPSNLPKAPEDDFTPTYQGLSITPKIAADKSDRTSLLLRFANDSESTNLSISNIKWSVGALSGKLEKAPVVAVGKLWEYEISLPGLAEGAHYPFSLTADIEGYKTISLTRQIDFNRVLQQTDKHDSVTIDLAKGNPVVDPAFGFSGEEDLSGKLSLRWDNDNLYLSGEIRDDVFSHGSSGIEIFHNDGIQFSIGPGMPGDSGTWYEYGLAMTPNGPEIYRWMAMQGMKTGSVKNGILKIDRDEDKKTTSYRLSLPWTELKPIQPGEGQSLSFSLLVNDNDGAGRKGYIEWGGGIGGLKDPTLFRNIILMGPLIEDGNSGSNSGNGSGGEGVPSTTVEQGSITVKQPANGAADILLRVEEVIRALEKNEGELNVIVENNGTGSRTDGAVILVPASVIEAMKGKADSLVVHINGAAISTPLKAMAASGASDGKPLSIGLKMTDAASLTEGAREAWAGLPIYDYSLTVDGKPIDSGAELATVSIKYALKAGEEPHRIVAYVIAEDGKPSVITNAKFDKSTGVLTFQTTRSGQFGVKHVVSPFSDLAEANWARQMIETLAVREIVSGTPDGKYEPKQLITRAEFVHSLVHLLQLESGSKQAAVFADIAADSEYRAAIDIASALGIVKGRENGLFDPNAAISREEMATLLFRALPELKRGNEFSGDVSFKDWTSIGRYARQSVQALHAAGLIQGYPDGSFKPRGVTTRAEAATVLYRLWNR